MNKILLSVVAVAGLALLSAAPASAEIVTSTTSLGGATLKAAQTTGVVVKAIVVNTHAAANTFHFYDGTTLKFSISVATGTTQTINVKELLGEEWKVAGALIVKAKVEDADGRVTCSIETKRAN